MARKVKTPKAPLSRIDKLIYVTTWLVSFAWLFVIMFAFGYMIPDAVAFSDPTVVAHNDSLLLLCCVPMAFYMSLTPGILASLGWERKQPIFGNKKFKPKFGRPVIKTFPLFSKEFRDSLSEKQKKRIKRIAVVLLILFLVCAVILPFGIYPRTTLDNENIFKTYNSFNRVTHEAALEGATCAVIDITYSGGGRHGSPHWGIEMEFVFEEKSYCVTLGSFGDMEREDVLRYMLSLKEYFQNGQYEITNIERMKKLINDKNFSESEQKLVYELFDYTP